jgi:pyridoxal phosphate enzyme (YggS family)
MVSIEKNITSVKQRIEQAAAQAGRDPNSIKLLAVSKTRPINDIQVAYKAGLNALGENYVQEATDKIKSLETLGAEWHFIGPLQSNKTRPVTEHFDWVHSVDRIKIAKRLSEQRPEHLPPLNICLQINIDAEPSKSGALPEQAIDLALRVSQLPNVRLRGLMAIPRACDTLEAQRQPFSCIATIKRTN